MDCKIKELYLEQRLSQAQIAQKLDMPVHRVQYVIDKNEWKKDKAEPIDKATLSSLLLESLLSKNEIAKRYNVSPSVVTRLIKKYQIRELTKTEKRIMREKASGTKKYDITKEQLFNLFITQNKTVIECAEYYATSEGNIKRLLKKFNIQKDRVSIIQNSQERQKELYGGTGFQLWNQGDYPFQNPDWQKQQWERRNKHLIHPIESKQDMEQILSDLEKQGEKLFIQNIAKYTGYGEAAIGQKLIAFNLRDRVTIKESYFEQIVENFLKDNNIKYKRRDRSIIAPKELDFVIEEQKIAIEVNDIATHGEDYHDKYYHLSKTQECAKQGYYLIHIFQWELDRLDTILSPLLEKTVIGARKTKLREISSREAREFLNMYHRQRAGVSASINLGLFYNDELVQVMNFRVARNKARADYELFRLCSKNNIVITGGASKLFNFFLKKYTPQTVISYCDMAHNRGNVYQKLGFSLSHISEPNYKWVGPSGEVLSRETTMKHKLVEQGFDSNQTEKQIMESRGFKRIFDSGNQVWYYNNIK